MWSVSLWQYAFNWQRPAKQVLELKMSMDTVASFERLNPHPLFWPLNCSWLLWVLSALRVALSKTSYIWLTHISRVSSLRLTVLFVEFSQKGISTIISTIIYTKYVSQKEVRGRKRPAVSLHYVCGRLFSALSNSRMHSWVLPAYWRL